MRYLSIILCFGLLACGPALEDLPNIAEVEVAPDADAASVLTTDEDVLAQDGLLTPILETEDGAAPTDGASANVRSPFGFLRRLRGPASTSDVPEPEADQTMLSGEQTAATDLAEPSSGVVRAAQSRDDDDAEAVEVSRGTLLPYGTLARVCDVRRADLGTEVARYPERGRGYRLYDTNPSSTGLRTHYITGFNDKCARQFTAALAIFGQTETHEAVRYDRSNRDLAYTDTDNAYESLKSRVCRVSINAPCSERRRSALDKDTVFVSVYERFLGNPRWADMLLHDGKVLAKDLKER